MLSFDICRKLAEAGFEQYESTARIWWRDGKPHGEPYAFEPESGLWAEYWDHFEEADCFECAQPNSDELIAAIQARFNVYPWLTTVPNQPCEAGAINEDEFDLVVAHGSTFITGNSPAEALAALYLALAEVTP